VNQPNKISQTVWSIVLVTAILLLFSFSNSEMNLFGYKTKKINLLSDIISFGELKKVPLPSFVVNDSIIAKDSVWIALRNSDAANILDF